VNRPKVIPGWIGWGNARVGLEVYAGTSGDRFVDLPEGPTVARTINAQGLALEGNGVVVVVVPERLIGNAEALKAWAERVASLIDGEVVVP
jgi:hypothetical protein